MHGTPGAREWQIEANDIVRTEWAVPDSKPLIAGCPGCGKTLFGCSMGKQALAEFGCGICLIVSPTINVKDNWSDTFNGFGIDAVAKVSNQTLKERLHYGESLIEDRQAICITYQQLAREPDLYVEMVRRYKGCLIADEPHHAADNKKFGEALNSVSEVAELRLALTGTPFNTAGTPLAMIDSEAQLLFDGRRVLRSKASYEYSYGRAIQENVCRPIEFITVMGRGEVTYRSLVNPNTWKNVIDLANPNAKLTHILATEGQFLTEMLETGIKALVEIKQTDRKAAMLVAVMDTLQAAAVYDLLRDQILPSHREWGPLAITKIVHDTDGASDRIKHLRTDNTDIVIAVRMISEGVDIPRLRVGVFASNYLTRMFFIQLVGRFVRFERRPGLDEHQFAKMVIPAQRELLEYAREIEHMVAEALIPVDGEGGGGKKREPTEIVGRETSATGKGAILRGESEDDISLANEFFRRYPQAIGLVPDLLATVIMHDFQVDISIPGEARQTGDNFAPPPQKPPGPSARKRNSSLVGRVVRQMSQNGRTDGDTYAYVNNKANQAVGIRAVDDLTTEADLVRRAEFLQAWLTQLYHGDAS